jgi:DNA-binding NarL/FixJ family response regulator/type II secretory pathway predicted ATPase ExeA
VTVFNKGMATPYPHARPGPRNALVGSERFGLPLRGRMSESAAADRAIEDVAAGESRILVIRGVAGSGKTRLVADIVARATARGGVSVVAVPDPDSHLLPTAVLVDAAVRSGLSLGADIDVESLSRDPSSRYWFVQVLRNALEATAQEREVVVVVDDLQWVDPVSVAILRSLVSGLSDLPILWVFAVRAGELEENFTLALDEWSARGETITVEPLSDAAVLDMASDLLGAVPDGRLTTALRRAENLPLLVTELVQGLVEEGLISVTGDVATATVSQVPDRFGASIRERIARLPFGGAHLVQVASIFGRTFTLANLAELLDATTSDLVQGVEAAIRSEILIDGPSLRFRHDAIRETAESMLAESVRAHLRRRAADIRLRSGEPLLAVAASVASSATRGDSAAVEMLHDAALQLAPVDATGAASLASRAVELAPLNATPPLFADLIPVLWVGGRVGEATRLAARLQPLLDPNGRARTELAIARLQTESSFSDAIATCERALAAPGLSLAVRAQLLAVRSLNYANLGDHVSLAQSLVEARAVGELAGDMASLATVDATESVLRFYENRWEEATALIESAVERMMRVTGTEAAQWLPEGLWPAFLANATGDSRAALQIVEHSVEVSQRKNSAISLAFWTMVRCRVLFDLGEYSDAKIYAETVMAMSEDLALGDFAHATAGVVLYRIALAEGDFVSCQARLGRIRAMASSEALHLSGAWLLALTAYADGDLDAVVEMTHDAYATLAVPTPSLMTPADIADEAMLARMWRDVGETERLDRLITVSRQRVEANPTNDLAGAVAAHITGLVEQSADHLRLAADLLRRVDRPRALALALEDLGHALHRSGASGAESAWGEAADIFEGHGAVRDAGRLLRNLRGLGIRRRPKASPTHSGLLSSRESQVAERLARGATTKQVAADLSLSHHTVISHVRHIYDKWGISSRRALVERATDRSRASK